MKEKIFLSLKINISILSSSAEWLDWSRTILVLKYKTEEYFNNFVTQWMLELVSSQ